MARFSNAFTSVSSSTSSRVLKNEVVRERVEQELHVLVRSSRIPARRRFDGPYEGRLRLHGPEGSGPVTASKEKNSDEGGGGDKK